MNARSVGRVAAAVVALGVLVLLLVAWLTTPNPPAPTGASNTVRPEAPPPPGDGGVVDPGAVGVNIEELVDDAGRGEWTGRLSSGGARYRLTYEGLEPREEGVVEIVSLVLWLPGDEQSIVVHAGFGRIRRPHGEREPIEGRISSGIVAHIYDGRVENEGNEKGAARLAVVTLDSLTFERDRLLVRTDDDIRITADGVSAVLHGLSATLSEGQSPLRLLRVPGGGRVDIQPDTLRAAAAARRKSEPGGTNGGETVADDEEPAVESYYELMLADAIRLNAGTVSMEGSAVRALARLVDGALPQDAVANFERVRAGAEAPTGDDDDTTPAAPRATPESIALSWSGPMELRPLDQHPAELEDDAIHLAVSSPSPAGVRIADSATGIDARAASVAYGATRRAVALSGGGDIEGVRITVPDAAEFVGVALDMDLTTGVGHASGAHIVRAIGAAAGSDDPHAPGEIPMWIASTGRADFVLDTSDGPIGSGGPLRPRSVIVSDGAEARRGEAFLRGDSIRAAFTEPELGATLAGVSVRDHARAQDGRGSWIEGDAIDILFAPDARDSNRPAPFSARASGNLRAGTPEAELLAGSLEAEVVRDGQGDDAIGAFTIRDHVVVTLPDGTRATGDRVTGDARTRRAELTGAPASIARHDDSGNAELKSERFLLDGADRTLSVIGPGEAVAGSVDDLLAQRLVTVQWDRSFLYDDTRGRAEVAGAVAVRADEDVVTDAGTTGMRVHTATGDRVTLDLAVLTDAPETGDPVALRRLVRAMIEGLGGDDPQWARVESRVYALDADNSRRLLGVLFITGPLMDTRPDDRGVAVAGPGRLLIDNRVQRPEDAELIGAGPRSLESALGTSLFEWSGRMDLDGLAGTARMQDSVSFRHLDATSGVVTDLRADMLDAGFDLEDERNQRVALRSVTATGSVVVRHGSVQVVCDTARYDALTGEIVAGATGGRRVTVLDEATGRQEEAAAIRLNLATGAWSIEDPSAISVRLR